MEKQQKLTGREKYETVKEQMIQMFKENKLNEEEMKFVAILIKEDIENDQREKGKTILPSNKL